ncbi:MAG: hypothetical protein O2979_11445, partial [Proteobacteria bacterium]|nr:hypothetical protein [Pseudomonadota bacterium]
MRASPRARTAGRWSKGGASEPAGHALPGPCATTFRAQPTQLSARGGMVRCGKCAIVFDGVAHLVEEGAGVSAEPSPQLGLFEAGGAPSGPAKAPARA